MLPKKTEKTLGYSVMRGFRSSYTRQRKRIARKLGNPRINQITFHTFRQWNTTKDILHVMKLLGHENIKNTLIYTQLVTFENDYSVCKVVTTVKEATELIELCFEYVCDIDKVKLSIKPK